MHNISIIIPHYNSPLLLKKLLDTIPDKEDIQVIVIDDNSTKYKEELEDIKRTYHSRVAFYVNNTGIQSAGACRNIGLDHADGKWVMFADADDYFLPGMYGVVRKYFDSDNDLIIFCPTSIYLDTGLPADRHTVHKERIDQYIANPTHENLMNVKRMKAPWSKIIRKQVIDDYSIRFSTTKHHNDMYFVAMVHCLCKKTVVSDDVIYCVTRNRGSLTTKITLEAFECHVEEYIKCYKFCKDNYNKDDFFVLNWNGAFCLHEAIARHLGFQVVLRTALKFIKNGVPIITWRMVSPWYVYKTLKYNNGLVKKERKYYV